MRVEQDRLRREKHQINHRRAKFGVKRVVSRDINLRRGEVQPKGMGDRHETVSVNAVGRALRVPVDVANVKIPAHSVQAREKQLMFEQVNYGGVVSVRVDISKVPGSSPHP
jgi:hypothetical protein